MVVCYLQVRSAYERAKNRLIVADYDGTLTQLQSVPQVSQHSLATAACACSLA